MADAWLPGAGRLPSKHDGGPLKGGAPRAVWHTSENDPWRISARSVAQRLEQQGRNAHLIWNPCSGEIVQMMPATLAARMLSGGIGQEGRMCFQIVVVGSARKPFTGGPLEGLESIVGWLDSWHVPRRWPAGEPLPSPEAYHAARGRRSWARGGYFGSSQVPGMSDPAPGAIDIYKITSSEAPRGVPRPRAAPGEAAPLSGRDEPLGHRLQAPDRMQPPAQAPVRASSPS